MWTCVVVQRFPFASTPRPPLRSLHDYICSLISFHSQRAPHLRPTLLPSFFSCCLLRQEHVTIFDIYQTHHDRVQASLKSFSYIYAIRIQKTINKRHSSRNAVFQYGDHEFQEERTRGSRYTETEAQSPTQQSPTQQSQTSAKRSNFQIQLTSILNGILKRIVTLGLQLCVFSWLTTLPRSVARQAQTN